MAVNLGLLGVSALVALAAGEGVLRLFPDLLPEEAQIRLEWARAESPVQTLPHPYVGYIGRPDTLIETSGGEVDFAFVSDENGFRNPSPWPDSVEVLIVGDSQAMGYGVADEDVWVNVLRDGLGPNRVITLGMAGAAPQQYTRLYETFGVDLAPRVVLFGLFPGNDLMDARQFADWLAAGAEGNFHVWRYFGGDVEEPDATPFWQRSYLYLGLRAFRANARLQSSGKTITFPDGRKVVLAPGMVSRQARRADPDHGDFQLVMEAIEEGRRLAQENDSEFIVLLFPTKEEVYLPLQGEPTPKLVEPFAEELGRRGIPLLDLTPVLMREAEAVGRLFFQYDGHPDSLGNRVIARTVLEHLRRHADEYGLGEF